MEAAAAGGPIIPRRSGVEARSLVLAGLAALLVLMGGVGATLIHATMRNDRLANARDQQAVILALKARMNEMERALAGLTAGREEEVLEDLAAGRRDGLRALISRPLHEGFGFEYTFVVDAQGQLIYASGSGPQDTAAAFEWIHPAVTRALAEPSGEARASFVVTPQRAGHGPTAHPGDRGSGG